MPFSFPLFLVLLTFVLMSIALGLKFYEWWRRREVSAMLKTATEGPASPSTELLRGMAGGKRALVEGWLERFALLKKLETLIRQAGVEWTPGGLLLLMTAASLAGLAATLFLPPVFIRSWTAPPLMGLLGALPILYLRRKRDKRLAAFEEQFPEALDFLARSMRAGHAFTISLKIHPSRWAWNSVRCSTSRISVLRSTWRSTTSPSGYRSWMCASLSRRWSCRNRPGATLGRS